MKQFGERVDLPPSHEGKNMGYGETTSPEIERIAKSVVDAIFKVHSKTGPGLLESAYESCLEFELKRRGLRIQRQVTVPLVYDGVQLASAFKIDLLVEDQIIIELKAVERMIPLYQAQVITYLKLTGLRLAFLVNFNVALIKEGVHRIIL